ncbi:HIT family protein [Candidatus Woesearchaeota archaeon]|nr:HIT family protein [Candidatus Woesearchaeota archaeon]
MACIFCAIASKKVQPKTVYEDEHLLAVLPDEPAVAGHILVIPKKHLPIFEEMDDTLTSHVFSIANKLSIALFESIGAQGTNILVQNGIPAGQEVAHFSINILPRKENDLLNLEWQVKQLSDEETSTIELTLKEGIEKLQQTDKKAVAEKQEATALSVSTGGEENYLIKQLRRIP